MFKIAGSPRRVLAIEKFRTLSGWGSVFCTEIDMGIWQPEKWSGAERIPFSFCLNPTTRLAQWPGKYCTRIILSLYLEVAFPQLGI